MSEMQQAVKHLMEKEGGVPSKNLNFLPKHKMFHQSWMPKWSREAENCKKHRESWGSGTLGHTDSYLKGALANELVNSLHKGRQGPLWILPRSITPISATPENLRVL